MAKKYAFEIDCENTAKKVLEHLMNERINTALDVALRGTRLRPEYLALRVSEIVLVLQEESPAILHLFLRELTKRHAEKLARAAI